MTLWVTDQKALMVSSYCIVCEEITHVAFPLTMLFKGCPKPTKTINKPMLVIRPNTTEDKDFLHSLGIGDNDEPRSES